MERRVLLAVFLSFLVLYIYQALVGPPPPPPTAELVTSTPPTAEGSEPSPAPVAPDVQGQPRTQQAPATITAVKRPSPDPVVADTMPRDIIVESDLFRARFANQGAHLVSWELKNYLDAGASVELVPVEPASEEPWPFSLLFEDETYTYLAEDALYKPSAGRLRLTDRAERVAFEYEDATGLRIRKIFEFDPVARPYQVRLTVEASASGEVLNPTIRWGPALGGVRRARGGMFGLPQQGPQGLLYGRVVDDGILGDPDLEHLTPDDVAGQTTYDGELAFVGVDNHYFVAVALTGSQEATVSYRRYRLPAQPAIPDGEEQDLVAFDLTLRSPVTELPFFLGPKDFDVLETADPVLVRAIDFGFLSALVVPLHRSLKWVHGFVGNWGWAIIILTVLINVIIFPLNHKSVVSMRKMQELQPEMKAIQERYKNLKATDPDKQKMNQEIMALYRDRKVNPASGCLPMLLTMPILFAFYRLLSAAIELRGAPFMWWIEDLSARDPFYITPIVMGGTMLLQQRMTPTQGDPMQQKIMMFMPIFFTFLFLGMPSGLVLYWLTGNVLRIGQQVVTNRIIGPPKVRTVRPPAERRVKKNVPKTKGAKKVRNTAATQGAK